MSKNVLILGVVAAVVALAALLYEGRSNEVNKQSTAESAQYPHDDMIVIPYGQYEQNQVELAVSYEGDAELRVVFEDGNAGIHKNEVLMYLRDEVLQIFESNEPLSIEDSSYSVVLVRGRPIWAPYMTMGPDGHTRNLFFGENASVRGNTIYIDGRSASEIGYDGYRLWETSSES